MKVNLYRFPPLLGSRFICRPCVFAPIAAGADPIVNNVPLEPEDWGCVLPNPPVEPKPEGGRDELGVAGDPGWDPNINGFIDDPPPKVEVGWPKVDGLLGAEPDD